MGRRSDLERRAWMVGRTRLWHNLQFDRRATRFARVLISQERQMINPVKAGITFGALLGVYHLCWALMVALGWAQSLMNFVFWMHFIRPVYVIQPFDLFIAAVLVIVTSVIGFVIAFVFGLLWNRLHRYQIAGPRK